jgi:hypothetical protein
MSSLHEYLESLAEASNLIPDRWVNIEVLHLTLNVSSPFDREVGHLLLVS